MNRCKCTAIVLAAGQGKRMGSKIQKQFLEINGKPVIYYSLQAFQESDYIDEVILVTSKDAISYCENMIVKQYGFTKVTSIVCGGSERYYSVWNGLKKVNHDGIVFIHDGARPFINEEIIERAYLATCEHHAAVVGMPVKDTIKIADENGFAKETPNRNFVWAVQTPQVFAVSLIKEAYEKLMERDDVPVTDDAMVAECMLGTKVKLVKGSYENIKITTPEDLVVAESFLKK